MDELDAAALTAMYDNLRSVYLGGHSKPPGGSVLFGLLDMKSKNKRAEVLREAAVPADALGAVAASLVDRGLADFTSIDGSVTLTAQGIWEAERTREAVDCAELIQFLEVKFFDCFSDLKASLSDKEKIILFVMLGVRAFSADTGVNLRREEAHSTWQRAVEDAAKYLHDAGLVGDDVMTDVLELGAKGTSLKPLQHFFRYTENIQRKTDGAFIAKSLNYHLKFPKDGSVDKNKVGYLFGLVLGDRVDLVMVGRVLAFCKAKAYDVATTAYAPGSATFATHEYDKLIESALRELALGS